MSTRNEVVVVHILAIHKKNLNEVSYISDTVVAVSPIAVLLNRNPYMAFDNDDITTPIVNG